MKKTIAFGIVIALLSSPGLWAGTKSKNPPTLNSALFQPTNLQRFRASWALEGLTENTSTVQGKKSVSKALLYSAVLPGAGQWYAGSRLKSVIFFVVEAAAWTDYLIYHKKGVDQEDQYRAFADRHWDYFKWIASGDTSGTHHIPVDANGNPVKTFDYYEMIGKYDQFNSGWDDTESREVISQRRLHYMDMRHDANHYFRLATLGTTIALANHVLSALDASFSVSRYNRRRVKTSLRLENSKTGPKATLAVQW